MTTLIDIGTVSFLLLIAFLIRRRMPFFYKCFVPASLLAGVIGLILGPQVLGHFSPVCITLSKGVGQWTNLLISFVFTTSFLGAPTTKIGRDVISTTCINGVVFMSQVLVGLGIAFGLSFIIDKSPYYIGLLPVSGFYGGHGSASIMGASFQNAGIEDAIGIAMTYATIGLFVAVICGMWIVNWGASRGLVRRKMDRTALEEKDITGIIPKADRKPIGMTIANPSVLDPLAFQLMIVGTVIAISHVLREAIIKVLPLWKIIPLPTMCLIMGAIIGILVAKTKYNQYIDSGSMKRISGLSLEYLIVVNVATIKISVLLTYILPIIITSIAVTVITAIVALLLAKKWYGDDWFELGIGVFGQCTGNLPSGLLLIKVLDPYGDTITAESVAGACTLASFWQQPFNVIVPMVLLATPMVVVLGTTGLLIAFLVVGTVLFGRKVKAKAQSK